MIIRNQLSTIAVVCLAAGLLAGCAAMACDPKAEEAKIQALNKQWLGAVARGDAAMIGELYAADGSLLPSNSPIATGRENVAAAWKGMLSLPGFSLNFRPTRIDIAASGDLASDIGTYDLAYDGKDGRVTDKGKYVVVWKKVKGQWRVLADIFNSDLKAQ